ncbi:MAG TPA: flagellar basal body P-ring formation chaperone FlgA [Candidatus Wunengus sp. YC60]|uniref:flagellar basal body P-ring formation chaperone FlgA n=1 Tax=Candidatus Wunengus sp. YC60 TaxID=3367697 RepID=UPI0040278658
MKLNILIFLPVAIFSITHTAVGEKINIEIKDKVTLPEKQMVLGDIAYVSCNNPSLLERINNISIGNTPWPGNIRKIEKDTLNARFIDEGIDLKEIAYGSTTSSLISVDSITITGEEIIRKAKEYLLSKLSRPESEVIIESDRPPMDKLLPDNGGDIRWEISQIDTNKDKGNVQLIVRISINEKQYVKIPVFFNIRTYEDIVIPNKKINRHDILATDDLVIKRMETTKLAGVSFDNTEDLIGKRAVRPILPNIPITAEMIDNPPLIKKGDFIKVSVQSGNLHIVTKGVAKEDGYLGKVIRIKNIDSNKDLYGKVEDSTTVKIVF